MDDAWSSATAHGDILLKNYKIQSLTMYVCICVACIHFTGVYKKVFLCKAQLKVIGGIRHSTHLFLTKNVRSPVKSLFISHSVTPQRAQTHICGRDTGSHFHFSTVIRGFISENMCMCG